MNLLIVKLSAVGDVIHTLPSLAALRRLYPEAHITWLVEEGASDLIAGHPYLDRVLISKRKTWLKDLRRGRGVSRTLKEVKTFLEDLRDRPYDIVIDFHGLLKSAFLVFLSRGKRKLGYDSLQEMSGWFYNEKIFEDMQKHAILRYLDFVAHLGANPENPEFVIPVSEENRARVDRLLGRHGIGPDDSFVAVNPVAYWDTKLWETEKFRELCRRMGEDLGTPVVLTGSRADGMLREISEGRPEAVNLAGETTLRDLAEIYGRARLVVTTDSGPMHLAAAMGTPAVALFGPTDPKRTGPFGENHVVIRKDLPCSPCLLKKCERKACMKEITVTEVLEAVRDLWDRRKKKKG